MNWGIDEETIWLDVKGQFSLDEDDFGDNLADYLKKHKHVPEIPWS